MSDNILTTAMGAWGDVFTSLTLIERLKSRVSKVDILYYGFDVEIAKFLEHQENIDSVIHVLPKSHDDYHKILDEAAQDKLDWIEAISDIKLMDRKILPTHLRYSSMIPELIFRKFSYKLPKIEQSYPKPCILLNPVSFHSCRFEEHWPFIPNAIEFLIKESGWNFILIGQEKTRHCLKGEYWDYPYQINMPNVVNLVGQTESMAQVLAIAELCDGIITTSNCLSMWSILSNKPAIVWLNSKLTHPFAVGHFYYREWITSKPNSIVSFDDDFATFMKVYEEWNRNLKSKDVPAAMESLGESQV
jgi:hypothetical protein